MKLLPALWLAACAFDAPGWAARCTTTLDARALKEYESYVAGAEQGMLARFVNSELSWVAEPAKAKTLLDLDSGKPVRRSISALSTNDRIADWNGTVIHWIGAIRIPNTGMDKLKAVLQDYDRYASIYNPIVYDCRAKPIAVAAGAAYDVTYGYQNVYRVASLFPQRYSFQVKSRTDHSEEGSKSDPILRVHSRATEIRESDSGIPGRSDYLEQYKDHGILWALNTYWLARQKGPDLYVEFEAVTLARSVRDFVCRIGFLPVPKAVVFRVMDALPGESMELMLAATRTECERRVSERRVKASR